MNEKNMCDFSEVLENSNTKSLVKELSECFSTDEFGVDPALAARLNRIAWEILLKKRVSVNPLEDNGVLEYAHSAVLYCFKDDPGVENEVAATLEELKKIENEGNSWLGDVLKVLLCLHLSKTQILPERAKTVQELYREIVQKSISNSECMPKLKGASENSIFTCDTSIRFKNRDSDESLRELLQGVFFWRDESDDDVASSRSSTFNVDEGFVTPGNEVETSGSDDVQHNLFDLPEGDIETYNASPGRLTENTSSNESMFYDTKHFSIYAKEPSFCSHEILKYVQMSHGNTHVLSYDKLVHDVKALLIGISTGSFFKVDDKFYLKEGIFVIGLSTPFMKYICKKFILVGDNYLRLKKCLKSLKSSPSVILKAMAPCLQTFFYKYHTVINNISSEQSLLTIKQRVAILGEQIEFLAHLFTPLPDGVSLLNSFYCFLIRSQHPSPYNTIVLVFFKSGCNAYFDVLKQWLFYGKTDPELFIDQIVSAEKLKECSKSREDFKKAFRVNSKKAPSFLSAYEIYECGALTVLLRLYSKNDDFYIITMGRPSLELCCDLEQLKTLKNHCNKFYDRCSSQVAFKWLPQFNIDLREIAKMREATAAKIYHDIKSFENVLLRQKQMAQLKTYRETLHHELEAAFIQLQDDVNYELLLKREEQLHTKNLEDRENKYLNDLLSQFEKLKEENDKVSIRTAWKQKRLKLNEKRNQFLSNGGIDFEIEAKSSEKSINNIQENVCDNLPDVESVPLEQDLESVPLERDLEYVPLEKDLESVPLERDLESVPLEQDLESVPLERDLESVPLERDLESVPLEQDLESVPLERDLESVPLEQDLESVPLERDLESVPLEQDLESVPLERDLESVPLERDLESVPLERDLESVPLEQDLESVPLEQDLESVPLERDLESVPLEQDLESVPLEQDLESVPLEQDESVSTIEEDIEPNPSLRLAPTENSKLNIPSSTSRQVSEYETCCDMTEEDQLDDSNQSSFSTCTYDYTAQIREAQIREYIKKKLTKIEYDLLIKEFESHDPFIIKELVTKSIKIPLKVHKNLVNDALFYMFCEENNLFEHFTKMRNYFFLYDGVFALKLTDTLFTVVKEKKAQFLTFPILARVLNEACGNENRKEILFDFSNTAPSFDHTNPQVLDYLKLCYKPQWNLSFILTDATIEKYNSVFLFLLAIEQAAWHLKKLMYLLKIKYVDLNRSPKYKQIQLHRHVMFQFVTALKNYLAVVVFDTSWNNFMKKLFQDKSIEELYKSHCAYIKDIRFRCFLNSSSSSTLEHLMKILHNILVYCHVYEFGETEIKPSGQFTHQKYPKLEHTFNNFMAEAKYFTYLIETYSRNAQQHHFEILLEYLHTWSRLK